MSLATIYPWNYEVRFLLNPLSGTSVWLDAPHLRIAILDSARRPGENLQQPLVAGVIVPKGREHDWLFSTKNGHVQLMNKFFNLSRLFVVGNYVREEQRVYQSVQVEENLAQLHEQLNAVLEEFYSVDEQNHSAIRFLNYNDGLVARIARLPVAGGRSVGQFDVVDEELMVNGAKVFRRRMRCANMPHWLLVDSAIHPVDFDSRVMQIDLINPMVTQADQEFYVDNTVFVDSYSAAMLFALTPISRFLGPGDKKVLSLGQRAGALLSYLDAELDFQVAAADYDSEIIAAVRDFFNVPQSVKRLRSNPKTLLRDLNPPGQIVKGVSGPFGVILVDICSNEPRAKLGLCSPTRDMITMESLTRMRGLLVANGVLVIHVVPPDVLFYDDLIRNVKSLFDKVYLINITTDTEFVLAAIPGTLDLLPIQENNDLLADKIERMIPSACTLKEVVDI